MKYLIDYRLFEEALPKELWSKEKMEELFTPVINWELINTIRDLSLEYLDDGFELVIDPYYFYPAPSWSWFGIFKSKFSHDGDKIEWFGHNDIRSFVIAKVSSNKGMMEEEIPNLKLSYRIALTKNGKYRRGPRPLSHITIPRYYSDLFYVKETNELLKKVKEFYPSEDITIYEVDNF